MIEKGMSIQAHIVEQERQYPGATGKLTGLLMDLTYAAKVISREVNKAGLVDVLGITGDKNVHGEEVKKLDEFANDKIFNAMDHGGHLCIMASEEMEDAAPVPSKFPHGNMYFFLIRLTVHLILTLMLILEQFSPYIRRYLKVKVESLKIACKKDLIR